VLRRGLRAVVQVGAMTNPFKGQSQDYTSNPPPPNDVPPGARYRRYRRTQQAWLAEWTPDVDMSRISISAEDRAAGSPRDGDMIACNPANHADQWLVSAAYFAGNFEELP